MKFGIPCAENWASVPIAKPNELITLGEWQPVHTAPVGVRGLVYVRDHMPHQSPFTFGTVRESLSEERLRYILAEGLDGHWNITHWMPLPEPPK